MRKLLGFIQVLVTLAFVLFGVPKVLMPLPDLVAQGMLWIEDFPAWQVRAIGALEVLGALGLALPYVGNALPKVLVPAAAGGLALTMVGAFATHVRRGDPVASLIVTGVLFGLCGAIAAARFRDVQSS